MLNVTSAWTGAATTVIHQPTKIARLARTWTAAVFLAETLASSVGGAARHGARLLLSTAVFGVFRCAVRWRGLGPAQTQLPSITLLLRLKAVGARREIRARATTSSTIEVVFDLGLPTAFDLNKTDTGCAVYVSRPVFTNLPPYRSPDTVFIRYSTDVFDCLRDDTRGHVFIQISWRQVLKCAFCSGFQYRVGSYRERPQHTQTRTVSGTNRCWIVVQQALGTSVAI